MLILYSIWFLSFKLFQNRNFSFSSGYKVLFRHHVACLVLSGDFAMLMNAGMSAKQALVYNCVSSVLCLIGMVVGVAVGNLYSADLWIFAIIGGLFLYIALVDMVHVSCHIKYYETACTICEKYSGCKLFCTSRFFS